MMHSTRTSISVVLVLGLIGLLPQWLSAQQLVIPEARVSLIRDVRIPAREPGVVQEIRVREGASVASNEVLGQIDATLAAMQLETARLQSRVAQLQSKNDINLRYSEKSSEVAEADVERSRHAIRSFPKSITQAELDQLRLVAERSALAMEQAELEMQIAAMTSELRVSEEQVVKQRRDHRVIVSPLQGIVIEVYVQPGEWVQAGEAIARVVDLDRLRVEAFVDGTKYDKSLVGRQVTFTTRVARQTTPVVKQGKVVFVSPLVHPVNGDVSIWAEIDNADHAISPGMQGELVVLESQP